MTPRLRTVSGPATLSQDPTNLKPLTHPSHCARRMLLASLVVSWKILHDKTFSSRAWSKITGLTASEISNNEMIFLRDLLRWDMFVDRNLFWNWSSELEKAAWGAAQMREVRKEKRECRPAEQAGIVHRADADMDSMLAQIDDGSVRNYSASNLVYFLPAYRMTRAASVH
ncbi:hypothetical protein DFJ74DRAFT_660756 [Hyaloraphidium curvatum]|nr:hypothetical protein DFJ74DRAFT_660756 [Hyaloraphidium curvatum]